MVRLTFPIILHVRKDFGALSRAFNIVGIVRRPVGLSGARGRDIVAFNQLGRRFVFMSAIKFNSIAPLTHFVMVEIGGLEVIKYNRIIGCILKLSLENLIRVYYVV